MDDEELLRYSRHIMLPEVDVAGQQALLDASVLIVGLGGLGSPVAMYLAAAGVGHFRPRHAVCWIHVDDCVNCPVPDPAGAEAVIGDDLTFAESPYETLACHAACQIELG